MRLPTGMVRCICCKAPARPPTRPPASGPKTLGGVAPISIFKIACSFLCVAACVALAIILAVQGERHSGFAMRQLAIA